MQGRICVHHSDNSSQTSAIGISAWIEKLAYKK